jgi:TetR/AcrR family transcriptional regulator, transcriptional repressor for nem operon
MTCFWELGFDGASIAALEAAAGINRRQLSRDYGNKRALFLQALDDFTVFSGQRYLDRLEREGSGLDDISSTLTELAHPSRQPSGHLGCLICNTSLEPINSQDGDVRAKVLAFFQRIEDAYRTALVHAAADGDVRADPRQTARQLLGAHVALLCLARSRVPDDVLGDIAERTLASLR